MCGDDRTKVNGWILIPIMLMVAAFCMTINYNNSKIKKLEKRFQALVIKVYNIEKLKEY